MENNENLWWEKLPPSTTENKTKKSRPYLAIAGFGLVLAGMVGSIAFLPDPNAPKAGEFNSIQTPANAYDTINGCGATFVFEVPKETTGKLPDDFFDNPNGGDKITRNIPLNPMNVQAYGYYYDSNDDPPKVFYDYGKDDVNDIPSTVDYLSYMYKGWTVIWYENSAEEALKEILKEYAESKEKVLILPWISEGDRQIPLKRNFAFASWGISRSCELWDENVADQFIEKAENMYAQRDKEQYDAELDQNGELKLISP